MFCKYIFNNCDRCTRFERIIFIIWWRICDDFTCLRHTCTLAYDSHCPHGSGRVHFNMDQNDVKANAAKPALQNRYPLSPLMDWSDRKKAWTQPTCWLRRQWIFSGISELGKFPPVIQDTLLRAIKDSSLLTAIVPKYNSLDILQMVVENRESTLLVLRTFYSRRPFL